jgi:hypothetical protein
VSTPLHDDLERLRGRALDLIHRSADIRLRAEAAVREARQLRQECQEEETRFDFWSLAYETRPGRVARSAPGG